MSPQGDKKEKVQYHVCLGIPSASTSGINLLRARNYCAILIKQKFLLFF